MGFTLTWADVVKIAPDLSTLSAEQQTAVLADVDAQLNEAAFSTAARYTLACKYLAAHLGVLVKRGADETPGPLVSESVGTVSRTYAIGEAMSDAALGSTSYGVQYQGVVRQTAGRIGVLL
jgi:hypothetical protein